MRKAGPAIIIAQMALDVRGAFPMQYHERFFISTGRVPAHTFTRLQPYGPARIPLVCGAPFDNGQSPPAQSNAKVIGSRLASRSCAASTKQITITAPNVTAQIAFRMVAEVPSFGVSL